MATYNFDNIQLDEGDAGIVWIPGIGFRPRDVTEELCGQVVGENQCTSDTCEGKFKWEAPPLYAEPYFSELYATPYITHPYVPPVITTTYDPPVIWHDIPTFVPFGRPTYDPPPTSDPFCLVGCEPPVVVTCVGDCGDPPNVVPIMGTLPLLLTALAAVIIWRNK